MPTTLSCIAVNYSWMLTVPTKERYERDKEGSFRKMYSLSGSGATDYAEMAGYAPSKIGYAKVIVKDCNVVGVSKVVV